MSESYHNRPIVSIVSWGGAGVTHDWDAAQTPILIDGEINGRPRKLFA
jgi:hypothetical protein